MKLILSCAAVAAFLAFGSDSGDAAKTVDRLQRALESRERASVLEVVEETHAWDALADSARGDLSLDDESRARLIEALPALVVARRMAILPEGARFGESSILKVESLSATVESSVVEADGDVVPLHYRLSREGGSWRITQAGSDRYTYLSFNEEFVGNHTGPELVAAVRAAEARYSEEASGVVKRLQSSLIDVMRRGNDLGLEGRIEALTGLVIDTHDLDTVVRLSVGKRWSEATEEQATALQQRFRRLSVVTYAARFDDFSGESFEVLGEEPTRRGGRIVKSRLIKGNGEAVAFDYQMRRARGLWKILNIVVDGASDLAIKRAEYGQVLDDGGFAALIAELGDQILRYESGEGG